MNCIYLTVFKHPGAPLVTPPGALNARYICPTLQLGLVYIYMGKGEGEGEGEGEDEGGEQSPRALFSEHKT